MPGKLRMVCLDVHMGCGAFQMIIDDSAYYPRLRSDRLTGVNCQPTHTIGSYRDGIAYSSHKPQSYCSVFLICLST